MVAVDNVFSHRVLFQEIQLWDLQTARSVRKYTNLKQSRHVIRSCFGGVDGNFVVSGSEGDYFYLMSRRDVDLTDFFSRC